MEFKVQDVETNNEIIEQVSNEDINKYWNQFGKVISTEGIDNIIRLPYASSNIFANTIELAFYKHYPLRLDPNIIHLQIIHGISNHIKSNPEKYRNLFVEHNEKKHLEIFNYYLVMTSHAETWKESIIMLGNKIMDNMKCKLSIFNEKFSTTTKLDQTACQVGLMDCMQHYFTYGMLGGCGIPYIKLSGTPDDWKRLKESVSELRKIDLDWWLVELEPVLEQFYQASLGNVDKDFWTSICRWKSTSGTTPNITGWLCVFFPYYYGIVEPKKKSIADIRKSINIISDNEITIMIKEQLNDIQMIKVYKNDSVDILYAEYPYGKLIFNGKELKNGTIEENGILDNSIIYCISRPTKGLVINNELGNWKQNGICLDSNNLSSGISNIEFTYTNITDNIPHNMKVYSGFVGIHQDKITKELMPKVGMVIIYT